MKNNILLIGFMGAGKSKTGRVLSGYLNTPFKDLDQEIELSCDLSIPQIFQLKGEEFFRWKESVILAECLKSERLILACGGGVCESKENRSLIKQSDFLVIFLNTDFNVIINRIEKSDRPLIQNKSIQEIKSLWEERMNHYFDCADEIINDQEDLDALYRTCFFSK